MTPVAQRKQDQWRALLADIKPIRDAFGSGVTVVAAEFTDGTVLRRQPRIPSPEALDAVRRMYGTKPHASGAVHSSARKRR